MKKNKTSKRKQTRKTTRKRYSGGDENTNAMLSNVKSHLHKVSKSKLRAQENLMYRLHPHPRNLSKYEN